MHVRRTVPPGPRGRLGRRRRRAGVDYGNTETHWWDGSQLYGASKNKQDAVRTFEDGKLKIGDDGRLLPDPHEPAST